MHNPICSMKDNLLRDKLNGGLARHFGQDKTYAQLNSFYYWPCMRAYAKKFVENSICQRKNLEYKILFIPTNTKSTMGCCEYGFCSGTT